MLLYTSKKDDIDSTSFFWHAQLGVRNATHRHQPPQRTLRGQVDCFIQSFFMTGTGKHLLWNFAFVSPNGPDNRQFLLLQFSRQFIIREEIVCGDISSRSSNTLRQLQNHSCSLSDISLIASFSCIQLSVCALECIRINHNPNFQSVFPWLARNKHSKMAVTVKRYQLSVDGD